MFSDSLRTVRLMYFCHQDTVFVSMQKSPLGGNMHSCDFCALVKKECGKTDRYKAVNKAAYPSPLFLFWFLQTLYAVTDLLLSLAL